MIASCRAAWCGGELLPVGDDPSESDASRGVPDASSATGSGADVSPVGDAPPEAAPIRVIALSDMNGSYGSTAYGEAVVRAVSRVVEIHPDLVISLGDMVAGQRPGLDYPAMWAAFHETVTGRLSAAGIPFAVTPGNHDGSGYAAFEAERTEFVRQWSARRPAVVFLDDTHYPLRYSFVMGAALFVALDATIIGPLDREQREWLERQLEAGADKPAKIVFGHLPLYPVSHGREREVIGDPALERLLLRHGVGLYLAGHHHAYYPGRRGALRQVTAAALGGGNRPLLGESEPSPKSIVVIEIGPAGEIRIEAFGGARFDVPIGRETLPAGVEMGAMVIGRDDL